VRLQVGPIEYQLLVAEAVRRMIQMRTGEEITFHISEYLESTSGGNRFIPRLIGFITEQELDFFDLFCTVEKIGVKKALKAMARPVRESPTPSPGKTSSGSARCPASAPRPPSRYVTTLKRR